MDFEITPKMKLITNANYLWFDTTESLEIFTFQDNIDPEIGLDLSMGVEYRPFLNDNFIIIGGIANNRGVIAGAFMFGIGMQLGGGCASGTLFSVGSGARLG